MSIVMSADENYGIFLATAIASILVNAEDNDEFTFYILDCGLYDDAKSSITDLKKIKNFSVQYIKVSNKKLEQFYIPKKSRLTQAAYARIFIPELLPNLDRVLYLDVDMVILASLYELYNFDLEGYSVGVLNDGDPNIDTNRRLNLPDDSPSFCSAVLLIDIKTWRDMNITEELLNTADKMKERILFADQCVLQYHFKDNFKRIPACWGMRAENVKKRSRPNIIHYIGELKFGYPSRKHLYKYVKMTQYKKFPHQRMAWKVRNGLSCCREFLSWPWREQRAYVKKKIKKFKKIYLYWYSAL